MTPLEYYHRRAEECLLLAGKGADAAERDLMRELAACWARLVERTARKPGERHGGELHVARLAASSHGSAGC